MKHTFPLLTALLLVPLTALCAADVAEVGVWLADRRYDIPLDSNPESP